MTTSNDPWTFTVGGTAFVFQWLRQDAGGAPGRATWSNEPRDVIRPLLGSADADVSSVGYTPPQISGQAYIDPANIGPYLTVNGRTGSLTDGTFTWTAYLKGAKIQGLVFAETEGAVVDITFTRARG